MIRIPKHILLAMALPLTLSAIYIQETRIEVMWFAVEFGVLGYLVRRPACRCCPS